MLIACTKIDFILISWYDRRMESDHRLAGCKRAAAFCVSGRSLASIPAGKIGTGERPYRVRQNLFAVPGRGNRLDRPSPARLPEDNKEWPANVVDHAFTGAGKRYRPGHGGSAAGAGHALAGGHPQRRYADGCTAATEKADARDHDHYTGKHSRAAGAKRLCTRVQRLTHCCSR